MAHRGQGNKTQPYASLLVVVLLVLALTAGVMGCTGGEDQTIEGMVSVVSEPSTDPSTATTVVVGADGLPIEDLSTFESKDPFIQQVVPTTAPETTTSTAANTTTTSYTTTTRYYPTTTTWWTTTTKPSTTTTTKPSTTTTTKPPTTTTTKPPYTHTLKIISVDEVGGAPACTFMVDGTIYENQRIGDVVSTSWGQIQVVDISISSTGSNYVTLLQGSETLTLEEGQQIYG